MKKLIALLAVPLLYVSAEAKECTVKDIAQKVISSPQSKYPSPYGPYDTYRRLFLDGFVKVSVTDRPPLGLGPEDIVEISVDGGGKLPYARYDVEKLKNLVGGFYFHYQGHEGFLEAYKKTIDAVCESDLK